MAYVKVFLSHAILLLPLGDPLRDGGPEGDVEVSGEGS